MEKPLRALMVEDSEDDVFLTVRALKKGGYDPVFARVETAETMRKALTENPWDIILCDYQMPQFNGLAAIAVLKETGIDIPLIIVSGAIGEETAVACMRSGARDYVIKGNLSRLVPAIERELKEAGSRSQLKRSEEALRKSEERFRRVSSMISDIAYSCSMKEDCRFSIDWMTGGTERITGYSIEEIKVQKCWRFLVIKEDLPLFDKNVTDLIPGSHGSCELRIQHKSGGIAWVKSYAECVMGTEMPESFLLYGGLVDITKSKLAEAELKESKALIEAVVENVPLMIFLKEATDLRFVIFNRAGEELLGHDRRDLIGKNNLDLFPPEQAANFMVKDREVLDGEAGMLDIPEEPILTAKKGERLLHTRKVCIRGPDGATKFLLGISEDITERKREEEHLKETLDSLRKAVGTTIQVMVSAVEIRDPYTAGHQIRSAGLARTIAMEMGLSPDTIEAIRMAGPIHDIGKLSVPAEILSKPTKLTNIEFSLIKEHARTGYELLKDVESPWPLAEIVYQHHERMDGSGYPRNLKGDDILMEARILAVSDVVESMASHRPYRPALGIEEALNEIEKNKGVLYDNTVADACLRLFREKGFQLEGAILNR